MIVRNWGRTSYPTLDQKSTDWQHSQSYEIGTIYYSKKYYWVCLWEKFYGNAPFLSTTFWRDHREHRNTRKCWRSGKRFLARCRLSLRPVVWAASAVSCWRWRGLGQRRAVTCKVYQMLLRFPVDAAILRVGEFCCFDKILERQLDCCSCVIRSVGPYSCWMTPSRVQTK